MIMRQGAIPAVLFLLCADEIAGYHLYCAFSNIVHTLHPSHLILLLQCLRDTLTNHHICHDVVEYELCFFIFLIAISFVFSLLHNAPYVTLASNRN